MLSVACAAEEGRAVADPGGQAGEDQRLPPDAADTDDHEAAEKHAGVGETRQGIQRAAARDGLVQNAREQREIQAADQGGNVGEKPGVKKRQGSLRAEIDEHDPERAPCLELLDILAVFIGAQPAADGEEQHARDGKGHANKDDRDHDDRGCDPGFQVSDPSLSDAKMRRMVFLFLIKTEYHKAERNTSMGSTHDRRTRGVI